MIRLRILTVPFLLLLQMLLILGLLPACGDGIPTDSSTSTTTIDTSSDGNGLSSDASATTGCVANVSGCVDGERFVCDADGKTLVKTPCDGDKKVCSQGQCVQCAVETDCPDGQICNVLNECRPWRLTITTTALASGLTGTPYKQDLTAEGGSQPYTWAITKGNLPAGLSLNANTGAITGSPNAGMDGTLTIEVTDTATPPAKDSKDLPLKIVDQGLIITTGSPLKNGQDGSPYSVQFTAAGGTPPYFWGVVPGGTLPGGLTLNSDGTLSGTLNGDGTFGFDIKVFDSGETTLKATKHFDLTVTIAPLDIVGTQQVDLFIAKLIVLPLIVSASGIPLPYNQQLQAIGGKKPYHWVEQPMPGFVGSFIKNSGLPKGLTLADDGTVSGSVTDPKLAVTVDLSFLKLPAVSGFFFSAKVTDSEKSPQTKTGLFIIPTVPIGGP